jgi:predicted transcriptional regulator
MLTVKEEIKHLIDELPDDATLDDIEYHLYVRRKIETSIQAVSNGEFVSHEEAIKQMRGWQEK